MKNIKRAQRLALRDGSPDEAIPQLPLKVGKKNRHMNFRNIAWLGVSWDTCPPGQTWVSQASVPGNPVGYSRKSDSK